MPTVMRDRQASARASRAGSGRRRCGRGALSLFALLAAALFAGRRARRRLVGRRRGDGHPAVAFLEQPVELVGLERLLLDQLVHHEVELVPVLREDLVRALTRAIDDVVDLGVDDLGDIFGVVALLLNLSAEEDELVRFPVLERAK